jgi:hypothetical protein
MPSIRALRACAALASMGAAGLAACDSSDTSTTSTTETTSSTAMGGGTTAMGGSGGSGASGGSGGGATTSSSNGGSGGAGGSATTSTSTGSGGAGTPCGAFAQRWGGDAATDEVRIAGAVVDVSGGAIFGGEIVGTVKVGGQSLVSAGAADALVVRLTEGGAIAWAKRIGAVYDDRVKGVAASTDGGAVLVGTFDGVVDFGGTTLTSIAGPDAFVMRLDADGQLDFVLQFEGADARAVSINNGGDILVTGGFKGTTTFGQIQLTSVDSDIFVARVTKFGEVVAAQRYTFEASPGALVIGAGTGRTYLAGSFQGTMDLGTGPVVSAGSKDVFVTRLDTALAPQMIKRFGDDTSQEARAVTVLPDGSCAIAGAFRGELDFGGSLLVADTLDDAFVAHLDDNGNTMFALRFGDAAEQSARAIAVDVTGDLLVAGGFQGTLDAGDGPITSDGGEDVFFTRLDPMGVAIQTMRWGAGGDQRARAVSADPCGAVLLGGDFTGTLPWDGDVLGATGAVDVFAARVAP